MTKPKAGYSTIPADMLLDGLETYRMWESNTKTDEYGTNSASNVIILLKALYSIWELKQSLNQPKQQEGQS